MNLPFLLLSLVLPYTTWFGLVFGAIKIDQAARIRKAREDPEPTSVLFEDKSITPYVMMALICGALVLPIYFYTTRRKASGFFLGLAFAAALVTYAVAFCNNLVLLSIYHVRLF